MTDGGEKNINVGVNGFGRIGRLFTRAALQRETFKIVAINDPFMTATYMAYLLVHDSVHGRFKLRVDVVGNDTLLVEGQTIKVFSFKDAAEIPWGELQVEFVAETSGAYTTNDKAKAHFAGGAKRVVISAPPKDESIPMLVMGVNHSQYDPSSMQIVSNASCTTNCLAPLAKIINDNFGIVEGLMTTVHAATATQLVVDGPSAKDWRAGRCALNNIIPATTGAAKAVTKVLPELQGKLTGMAFRVPVADVSVVDLTCRLERPVDDLHDIAAAIERACTEQSCDDINMRDIIGSTTQEVVSSDFVGDSRSCIVDVTASLLLHPTFLKVVAYYDNEWAYSTRMVDLIAHMHKAEGEEGQAQTTSLPDM